MNEQIYLQTREKKDHFFQPLLKSLTSIGIKPDLLSYLGVILSLVFYYLSDKNLLVAGIILIIAKLCDILDGPLARHQHKTNARGATIDIVCDQIVFLITILALIKLKLMNFLLGASLLVLVFSSKALRSIYHKTFHQFERKYKDLLLPIVITSIPYFTIIFHYFWGVKNFDVLIGILAMILIIDCAVYLFKLIFR